MFGNLREDFPTLSGENAPVYLDNACMTLRPNSVIEAIRSYYEESPGCGGRSVHRYATTVSRKMVNCRNNLGNYSMQMNQMKSFSQKTQRTLSIRWLKD